MSSDGDAEPTAEPVELTAEPSGAKPSAKRGRKVLAVTLAVLVILLGGAVVSGATYYHDVRLPADISLPERTTIYYRDGTTVLARLGEQNRSLIDVRALPEYVRWAVVAAEDPSFFERSGDDLTGMAKAGWHQAFGPGHPNLSQQYAALITGSDDELRNSVLASKLEKKYSHDDLLGFYLNTVSFGRGAFGIEAAAEEYFGKSAKNLTLAEALALAGILRWPGEEITAERWAEVRDAMLALHRIEPADVDRLAFPAIRPPGPVAVLPGPAGLIVRQVLNELRQSAVFRDRPKGFIENGGFQIYTTVDVAAQRATEAAADETVSGSLLYGEPKNLQAAVVLVEAGTGRVLAYFGGHEATGEDYAGVRPHPPGASFFPYVLAAGLKAGVSVQSKWDASSPKEFPASDRVPGKLGGVRNSSTAPCGSTCTLVQSTIASLNTPLFGLTEQVGADKVIDTAKAAGITTMWTTGPTGVQPIDLRTTTGHDVSPKYFATEVGLGQYPVTVVDQANAMATFAADGKRADAHFVRHVMLGGRPVYGERIEPKDIGLSPGACADLTWTLSQVTAASLPDGRASAGKTGNWQYGPNLIQNADAWMVGYTRQIGVGVWIGNKGDGQPLKLRSGAPIYGSGLPASIYRRVIAAASANMPKLAFPPPVGVGDENLGNAALPAGR